MKKSNLMILDGWGSPDPKVSAIDNANVPFINSLYRNFPSAQLRTDGLNVVCLMAKWGTVKLTYESWRWSNCVSRFS
jgi:bisphosphoglycerate-independent phosphoglycerate mutase (AlkP superfamily)